MKMVAITKPIKKPIKIRWAAPNGKEYEDTVFMTLDEYETFVNNLNNLKKKNNRD